MVFHNPEAFWFLLSIPVLVLIGALLSILSVRDRRRLADPALFEALARSVSKGRRRLKLACFYLGIFFLVIAAAEPRFGTKTELVKHTGVDIVIALDTSFSMLAEDVKPSRMSQAKYEIGRLIDSLEGDRVALLVFSGKSYVQCPLTSDYGASKTMLDFVDAGIVPVPGTNIGEAITASLDLLSRGSEVGGESQMILLFTDGENLEGEPEDAAKLANDKGVHIVTVGIGTSAGELIPMRGENGQLEGYKTDKKGEIVKSALNEEVLRRIALVSGGAYLREVNGEVNVKSILDELGSLKKTDLNERKISRLRERYQIPLGASLLFLLAWLAISDRRRGKIENGWRNQS